LPEARVTVQSLLDGGRLGGRVDTTGRCGRLLAALHSAPLTDLPLASPARQLRLGASTAGLVVTVVPSLRPRVERLLARLEETAPEGARLVSSHGDFYANQVLEVGGELAVVDLDQMCRAPAALDLASYAAYSLRGDSDLAPAAAAVEGLAASYGERPEGLPWYLATCVLRRAHTPFRRLDERWPERVGALVGAAEAALSLE
jgi:Ser/Thr protein kinase RdoA (MazF antagonist)